MSVRREFPYQVTEPNQENNKMTTENTKSYVDLSSNVSMDELLNGTEKSNNFAEGSIVPGKIVEKRRCSRRHRLQGGRLYPQHRIQKLE